MGHVPKGKGLIQHKEFYTYAKLTAKYSAKKHRTMCPVRRGYLTEGREACFLLPTVSRPEGQGGKKTPSAQLGGPGRICDGMAAILGR